MRSVALTASAAVMVAAIMLSATVLPSVEAMTNCAQFNATACRTADMCFLNGNTCEMKACRLLNYTQCAMADLVCQPMSSSSSTTGHICNPKPCLSFQSNPTACVMTGCVASGDLCTAPNCSTSTKCPADRCTRASTGKCEEHPCSWFQADGCNLRHDCMYNDTTHTCVVKPAPQTTTTTAPGSATTTMAPAGDTTTAAASGATTTAAAAGATTTEMAATTTEMAAATTTQMAAATTTQMAAATTTTTAAPDTTTTPAPTGDHGGWPATAQGYECVVLTAAQCAHAPLCEFSQARERCQPRPCGMFGRQQCALSTGCMLDPTNPDKCRAKACGVWNGNETACDMHPRCAYAAESLCIDVPCHGFAANKSMCEAHPSCTFTAAAAGTTAGASSCTRTTCMSHDSEDTCPYDRCRWNSNTNRCQPPVCATLGRAACSVDECMWDGTKNKCAAASCTYGTLTGVCPADRCVQGANFCAPKPCAMFTKATCPSDVCDISTDGKMCVPQACERMDGMSCDLARCQRTDSGMCMSKPCITLDAAVMCNLSPKCHWAETASACLDKPCPMVTDPRLCNGQCMYNNFTKTCADKPCALLTMEQCWVFSDRCTSVRTVTNGETKMQCAKRPCEQLAQWALCANDRNCEWTVATSTDAGTSGNPTGGSTSGSTSGTASTAQGYCATKRVNTPCEQRAMSDCVMPECLPDAINPDVCAPAPCRRFGTNATMCRMNSHRCAFNVSGSMACDEMPCRGMEAASCNASSRCMWHMDMCHAKPCSELQGAACDLGRCDVSSTGACRAIDCSQIQDRDACPAVECEWFGGVCATGKCQWLTEGATCGAAAGCAWVNATSSCVPTRMLSTVGCQHFSQRWCDAASERCQWNTATATAGTNTAAGGASASWCGPKQSPTMQATPCYTYTSMGADKCPTSQNCQWMYGSLCMNPLCARMNGNATACQQARCLYTAASTDASSTEVGKCVDPQEMRKPCWAFGVAACPRGTCDKNATHCFGFAATGTGGGSTTGGSNSDMPDGSSTPAVGSVDPATGLPVTGNDVACMMQTTLRACTQSTAECTWAQEKCVPLPCGQYEAGDKCPQTRCRTQLTASGARACGPVCPAGRFFCQASGTCASEASECRRCASNEVQCAADSSCRASLVECPCPLSGMTRCAQTRMCVLNATRECNVQCPANAPFKCWDASCASNETACPCPAAKPERCADQTCGVSADECKQRCPVDASVRCWNGKCVQRAGMCACSPNLPYRCPTTGVCMASALNCSCGFAGATRCADARCVLAATGCDKPEPACPTGQVRCSDGQCAADRMSCQCPELETVTPTIDIATRATSFDVTAALNVAARINYTVCGRDLQLQVRVRWTAADSATGAAVTRDGKQVRAWGHMLSVPKGFFTAGTRYVLTATAFVNASSEAAATASVVMAGVAPTPEVQLLGGDERMVPSTGIELNAAVSDAAATTAADAVKKVVWMCCGGADVAACAEACPAVLAAAVEAAQGKATVSVPSAVPAGNYTLTVVYKGIARTQVLRVAAKEVPRVRILAPRAPNADWIAFYAYTAFGGKPVTTTWYWNGTVHAGASEAVLRVKQPGSWAKVWVRVCDAADESACGTASLVYQPPAKIVGACTLAARDGTAAAAWTALKTPLKVASTWTAQSATLKFAFVLEYNATVTRGDASVTLEKRVVLAPYESELSDFEFTAPMLSGNADVTPVRVSVVARKAGSRDVVAVARCAPAALKAVALADDAAKQQLVADTRQELRAARDVNDTRAAFSAAATMAASVQLGGAGVNRSAVSREVVGAFKALITDKAERAAASAASSSATTTGGDAVTRTERSAAIQTLASLLRSQKAAGEELDTATQKDAAAVLLAALNTTDEDSMVDVAEDGAAALEALASLRPDAAGVASAADALARRVAATASFGVETRLESGNLTVAGVARTGSDLGDASVDAKDASMSLPANFSLAGAGASAVVSLSATAFAENPVGEAGLSADEKVVTSVADFNVLQDGVKRDVKDLTAAQRIRVVVHVKGDAAVNASRLQCKYWSEVVKQWVEDGVTTEGFNATTRQLWCLSTHLSTFGGSSSAPVGPSGPPVGPNPTPPNGPATTGTPAPPPTPTGQTSAPESPAPPGSTTEGPTALPAPPSAEDVTNKTVGIIVGASMMALFVVLVFTFFAIKRLKTIREADVEAFADPADAEMRLISPTAQQQQPQQPPPPVPEVSDIPAAARGDYDDYDYDDAEPASGRGYDAFAAQGTPSRVGQPVLAMDYAPRPDGPGVYEPMFNRHPSARSFNFATGPMPPPEGFSSESEFTDWSNDGGRRVLRPPRAHHRRPRANSERRPPRPTIMDL